MTDYVAPPQETTRFTPCPRCDGSGIVCRSPLPGERAQAELVTGRIFVHPNNVTPTRRRVSPAPIWLRIELCNCVRESWYSK